MSQSYWGPVLILIEETALTAAAWASGGAGPAGAASGIPSGGRGTRCSGRNPSIGKLELEHLSGSNLGCLPDHGPGFIAHDRVPARKNALIAQRR